MSLTAALSKPSPKAQFIASRFALSLVKVPIIRHLNPADGTEMSRTTGERIDFKNGLYEASKAEAEWMRQHPLFGDHSEGFLELEQIAPEPTTEELALIMQAAFDEDALHAILKAEEAGWARPKMLELAQQSLERLQLAQQLAAEDAAKAAAKK